MDALTAVAIALAIDPAVGALVEPAFEDVEAQELLDASQREAKAEEERRNAAKRAHHKQVRARRRKQQRREAKSLGHKLGQNSRKCKFCGNKRLTILETSLRCPGKPS
jgi:hypothetical protein